MVTNHDWYVFQTRPNGLAKARTNLARQGFETFSPVMPGAKPKPLFPGYGFVRFDIMEPGWTRIRSTLGVARLLSVTGTAPAPVPRAWMDRLLARCDADGNLLPQEDLAPGDTVQVVAGPLQDTLIRIDSLDPDGRIRFLFDILGSAHTTTIAREDVRRR